MQPMLMPMLLLQQGCQVKRCKQDIYFFLFLNKPLYSKNHKPMPNLMVSPFFNCYLLSLLRRRISFIYNWCHIWPPWSNLTSSTLRYLQIYLRPETELNSLDCHVLWIRRISNQHRFIKSWQRTPGFVNKYWADWAIKLDCNDSNIMYRYKITT